MNYIINGNTLWIERKENKIYINEMGFNKVIYNGNIREIINKSCLYYGSSYHGRIQGSSLILEANYKLPIIIKDNAELIVFPLVTSTLKDPIWFIYNNIKEYHQIKKNKVLVEFTNGQTEAFNVSFYTFNQQILKSSRLYVVSKTRNG